MAPRRVAVAYSGGRDSTALLRATLDMAAPLGIEVLALHVHHGLNPAADAWLAACEAQCRRWAAADLALRFDYRRLETRPVRGESVEAWARAARYRALGEMALAHGVTLVLLAHHRRDQAETLLLQALRGAGVSGLAGMPAQAVREGITWARPWLDQPGAAIDDFVRHHRLEHIVDDSNVDPRYARNRIRREVWPALTTAFPHAEASLADAARWAQEALACMDELAGIDLAVTTTARGLDIAAWRLLSPPRRSLALRAWLKQVTGSTAPASLVARLLEELDASRSARWPIEGGELRSYRNRLTFSSQVKAVEAPSAEATLCVLRAGRVDLPGWRGALRFTRVKEGGVPLAWLAHLELRQRSGGERFQAGLGRPPRSLKLQYQAAGLPAWLREGPIVYAGGQLVFAPGLGVDARVIGMPGQPQMNIAWEPHATR